MALHGGHTFLLGMYKKGGVCQMDLLLLLIGFALGAAFGIVVFSLLHCGTEEKK